ncbi:hypothetical protein [Acidovorax sp. MR-S7]|uniref:hypothetical protein n=1 Tax=Acidovorax sp. MR-S7 TaxID=1268622 RepID=UPI0003D3F407|nr:hypothetical protein [Acidovorax sp. MR-S7]GAD21707.1 hypothetical protein AVS7_01467 [Acidovorax sp. MR-S7]
MKVTAIETIECLRGQSVFGARFEGSICAQSALLSLRCHLRARFDAMFANGSTDVRFLTVHTQIIGALCAQGMVLSLEVD